MISYRDNVQLIIGRHYEEAVSYLFDVTIENYLNKKGQDVVNYVRQSFDKECRSAQCRLGVKKNASEINEVYMDYIRGCMPNDYKREERCSQEIHYTEI